MPTAPPTRSKSRRRRDDDQLSQSAFEGKTEKSDQLLVAVDSDADGEQEILEEDADNEMSVRPMPGQ